MPKVIRFMIADYLKEKSATAYELAGTGFTGFDESPSPKVDTKPYINDKAASSTITGYETTFSYDADLITEEKAVQMLKSVGDEQKTADAAELDYVRVNLFETPVSGTSYPARKFTVAVEAGDTSGEATELVTFSGTLHQVGDMVPGTFDTATKAFTPDTVTP